MATWTEVAALALSLPETDERCDREGLRTWLVRDLMFVWERPLRKSELDSLGDLAPTGPILGLRVADLTAKRAMLARGLDGCFTTPAFDGYSTVLVGLDQVEHEVLGDLVFEAWLARAPHWLATACLSSE